MNSASQQNLDMPHHTYTHTYSFLEISGVAFWEILCRLKNSGPEYIAEHVEQDDDKGMIIVFGTVALCQEPVFIFCMNDADRWLAPSHAAAVNSMREIYCLQNLEDSDLPENLDDLIQIQDADLDKLKIHIDDTICACGAEYMADAVAGKANRWRNVDDRLICQQHLNLSGEDCGKCTSIITFRQQLQRLRKAGTTYPQCFSSTEI